VARVELSETTQVPFGGRGARRKPDKEGGKFERSENNARRSMATRIASRTAEGTKETNGDAPKKA
jgi:hypothetical protein